MDDSAASLGAEIQRLRTSAQMSQQQLAAKAFVTRSALSMWELGSRYPSPGQLEALDAALGTDGALVDFAVGAPGLSYEAGWAESLKTITNMWDHDINRRALIRTAAFAPAALALPLQRWAERSGEKPGPGGRRRIGMAEVETIRTMTRAFRSLDNRFGGRTSRDGVVSFLNAEVSPLLKNGQYDSRAANDMLSSAAEVTQLAGWMSYDSGMHGAAERYFVQALRLAEAADDTLLGVEILAGMAHQAIHLGHGREAIDLADAAMRGARESGAPALIAESSVMAAHAHAISGNSAVCARLLTQAEQTLDGAARDADPQWLSYFGGAYLSAKTGHCLLALGDNTSAVDAARRSLDMDDSYVRGRMFNLALLATCLAAAGEPEEACATGQEARALTDNMRSARADDYMRRLVSELSSYDTRSRQFASTIQ